MPNGATGAQAGNGATAQDADGALQWFSNDVSILAMTTKRL